MRYSALRLLAPLLLSAWLAGCATTPPSAFYTLAPLPEAEKGLAGITGQSPSVGIGPISFPFFLDRSQIVERSGSTSLNVDELNRWGGSLADDFPRVLGENLAYLLGTSRILMHAADIRYPVDYRIAMDVLRFEGTPDGKVLLKVRWVVLNPYTEEATLVQERGYSVEAASGEPGAMVQAMSRALGDLSRDLAQAIQGLRKPSRPVEPPGL